MKEKITEITKSFTAGTSLYLLDIQMDGNKITIILDGDCGVNINDCAALSRHIRAQGLDAEDYQIEITSPGIDRSLSSLREYKKNVGRRLQIKNQQNKLFSGRLVYVDAERMILAGKSKRTIIENKNITEAKAII